MDKTKQKTSVIRVLHKEIKPALLSACITTEKRACKRIYVVFGIFLCLK